MNWNAKGFFPTLLVFVVAIAAFSILLLVNFVQIRSISSEISSYLLESAHLEEVTRAEMEADSLFQKALNFASGDPRVTRENLSLALDIFWSRIESLGSKNYNSTISGVSFKDDTLLREISKDLPRLEKAVSALQFGELRSYSEMTSFSKDYISRLSNFGDIAYVERRKRMNGIVERARDNLKKLEWFQTEIIGFGLLIFSYVVFQLFASQKLNNTLRQTLSENHILLTTDFLTGIHNRRHFEESFGKIPDSVDFSTMIIDLDGFKEVNDQFGHAAGDLVLQHVARVLKSLARENDIVARLGGDEFSVLFLGSPDLAIQYANSALERVAVPVGTKDFTVAVSCSIGLVQMHGKLPDTTLSRVLRDADLALYSAKAKGKNRVEILEAHVHRANPQTPVLQGEFPETLSTNRIRSKILSR